MIAYAFFLLWKGSCCSEPTANLNPGRQAARGQEMTKTVKLKRFYCQEQISALGTNSSKLVEIRMMTPKNHQSTTEPVPTCYNSPPPHTHTLVILPLLHTDPSICSLGGGTSEGRFKPLGGRFARGDFWPRSPTVRRRGRNLVTFLGSFWSPTIFWSPTTTDRLICPNSL